MDFKAVVSDEITKAVNAAATSLNTIKAGAAQLGGLGGSAVALQMVAGLEKEGEVMVDRLLALYSDAAQVSGKPVDQLQAVVTKAIEDFWRATSQMGLAPNAFADQRNGTFTRSYDHVKPRLLARARKYFAGYGAPKPEHWTVRRPVLWLVVQTAITTVVAAVVSAFTANLIAG